MPVESKSTEFPAAEAVPEAAAIREQLERLVAHPLFANSKRYPVLLAYAVEQTLRGNGAELKERSIGIEVFGRSPSYDANADPVVRITAGEVRKRLMQYYYDTGHDGEPVIELPVGSYVPLFRLPERMPEPAPDLQAQPADPLSQHPPVTLRLHATRRRWLLVGVLVGLAAIVGAGIGFRYRAIYDYQLRLPAADRD
jgi:hypothetical protein